MNSFPRSMGHSPQHTNTLEDILSLKHNSLDPYPPPLPYLWLPFPAKLFKELLTVFMFFPSIVLNSLQSVLYPDPATKTALPKFTRDFHITKFRVNSVFFSLDLLGAFNVVYHSHILETVFTWLVGYSQDFPSHWWFLPSLAFPTSQQSRDQDPFAGPFCLL